MTTASITLFCTVGSSDKQYTVTIQPASDGMFHVVCFNGKRGAAQKSQPKTKTPVSLEEAQGLYEKIVAEKKRGGYTPDESGKPYALSERAGSVSGWLPALLTEIGPDDLGRFLADDRWVASEKYDGERRGIELSHEETRGMNKKGLYVNIPAAWTHILAELPRDTILDGEHMEGDVLYVFDVVKLGGRDMTALSFEQREKEMLQLESLLQPHKDGGVVFVRTVRGEERKRALLKAVESAKGEGEGIVLRLLGGEYTPGEASNVASALMLKFKFVESATCIVSSHSNSKRSVGVSLLDADGSEVNVGSVKIPENKEVPALGDVVEVRFAYKFEQGCFFHAVYLGPRRDQAREDAVLRKIVRIKRKSSVKEEEEELMQDA